MTSSQESKVFQWQQQFNYGQEGEKAFENHFKDFIKKLPGRGADFIFTKPQYDFLPRMIIEDEKIELKSDQYYMTEESRAAGKPSTRNFFIERISVVADGSPGGPWQAREHGSNWFVYYFHNEGLMFWFYVPHTLEWLADHIQNDYPRSHVVHNRAYDTKGFIINRHKMAHLIWRADNINSGNSWVRNLLKEDKDALDELVKNYKL